MELEVVIEIPRRSFLKRGSTGHIDFVSPLPCPFNYGSVPHTSALKATCWMHGAGSTLASRVPRYR